MTNKTFETELKGLKNKFDLSAYLALRDDYPDQDPELYSLFDSAEEWYFSMLNKNLEIFKELQKHSVALENYFKMVEGDSHALDRLCLDCLNAIDKKKELTGNNSASVRYGKVISDQVINFVLSAMIESCSYHQLNFPTSLQIMLKVHLGFYQNKIITSFSQQSKKNLAAAYIAMFPELSDREVATRLGRDSTTISSWKKEPEFNEDIKNIKSLKKQ